MDISLSINVDGNVTTISKLHSWDEAKDTFDYLYYKFGLRNKVNITEKRLEDNRERIGYCGQHPIIEINNEKYVINSFDRMQQGWCCYKVEPVGSDEHGYVWTVKDDFTYIFNADGNLLEKWENWNR